MGRKYQRFCVWLLLCTVVCTGCTPVQPFYLEENGGALETFLDSATEISYADVQHESLGDVTGTLRPRTVANPDFDSIWDLTLEEAVATALNNSKVIRSVGNVRNFGQIVSGAPERLSASPNSVTTVYDPAIQETGQSGVAQALSQFDAVFNSNATWDRRDRRQNLSGFTTVTGDTRDQNDRLVINNEVVKRAATGSQFTFRNQTIYEHDLDPNNQRLVKSNWFTAMEAEFRQPLARGAGTQVNRIPIVLARIRTDTSLAVFETAVRNMMNEIETAYWELYFFYRNLNAAKQGRDSALSTWKRIYALSIEKAEGGEAQQEAQAREQYFFFRSRVEEALRDLYKSETRLRYLMGLSATDGRLIRPADEPTRARVAFDWNQIHGEALSRSVELRGQQWQIKAREMELIAARNQLLPQVDVVGLYRWLGQGDRFFDGNDPNVGDFPALTSQALDGLASGKYQEGQLGFQASVPIGFRRELSQVRSGQLALARDRARLEDMELEISHQLTDAIADLESQQMISQTHFNRLVASEAEVKAMEAAYDTGTVQLDRLLDAQRRRAEAEIAYYQAIVEYNLAIIMVHFRKGSLLDYNGVVLAEGPWPSKAYCDAHERARHRAASFPMDYGYSRPRVASNGPISQTPGAVQGVISQSASLNPMPEGNVISEGIIESPVIENNVIENGVIENGTVIENGGEIMQGEVIQGDVIQQQPMQGEIIQEGTSPGEVIYGEPTPMDSSPQPLEPPRIEYPSNPQDIIPDPVPSAPNNGGTIETRVKSLTNGRAKVSQPGVAQPKAAKAQPATSRPATRTSSTKSRSKVAQVTFVEDAPEPKSLSRKASTKIRNVKTTKDSNSEPDFEIRDPARNTPSTVIKWK